MGFIENSEAELRWGIQIGQAWTRVSALCPEEVVGISKKFQMHDGPGVFGRPGAIEMGLAEAVAKRLRLEWMKILIEAAHFGSPLGNERLGAHDDHVFEPLPRLKLLQHQPGLDCLSNADLVCYQQARTIGPEQPEEWFELEWDKLNPRGVQSVEV